jgi:hypothetical protein
MQEAHKKRGEAVFPNLSSIYGSIAFNFYNSDSLDIRHSSGQVPQLTPEYQNTKYENHLIAIMSDSLITLQRYI